MGEAQNQPFQLSFNPALKVEFQGSRVTSDGGLILVRELDQRLGFSDLIAQHLTGVGTFEGGIQVSNWKYPLQLFPRGAYSHFRCGR